MRQSAPLLKRKVQIVGVPLDLGAGRRGVDMGPQATRIAGLVPKLEALDYDVEDLGEVPVPRIEGLSVGDPKARYLKEITEVCNLAAKACFKGVSEGHQMLMVGGDHSAAVGSISGVSDAFEEQGKTLGVIWADAHADFNIPESTPSGNVHGMPLAALLGYGPKELTDMLSSRTKLRPENVALIGLRDVDDAEKVLLHRSGVTAFSMSDIDELGIQEVVRRALVVAGSKTDGIHLSFDVDGVDPQYAPGVGTPVPGGLTYREGHFIAEQVAATGKMVSMDLVEVNPVLDETNKTAKLAVELALSAFGKTTLLKK